MALKIVCSFVFSIFCVHGVNSNIFISSLKSSLPNLEYCTSVCEKTLPLESNKIVNTECCNRGCRFYGITELVGANKQLEYNISIEACHNSCFESYNDDSDQAACIMGCDTMANYQKKVFEFLTNEVAEVSLLSFLVEDGDLSQKFQVGDGDLEPDDTLMDPALKHQLILDLLKENRLPEMRVRSLPLNKDLYQEEWWKVCPRRREGVPRCLVASLLMLLFLLALWLTLSWEDKTCAPLPLPLAHSPPQLPKYSLLDDVRIKV